MKKGKLIVAMISALAAMTFFWVGAYAEEENTKTLSTATPVRVHGAGFVDLNGDGYNDNAPDADGDGIPNGQDPDWGQGTGNRHHHRHGGGPAHGQTGGNSYRHGMGRGAGGFVDENGDGCNDLAPDADGDGIPNGQDADFVRHSGTGRFAGHGPNFVDKDGDGVCDNSTGRSGRKPNPGQGKSK